MPSPGGPGFLWRLLSPIGAVVAAFAVLIAAAGALGATDLGDDATAALLTFGTSLLLATFALLLWRGLPAHERRLAVAVKHTRGGTVGLGVTIGIGIVIGATAIIVAGREVDPVVRRRLDEVEALGSAPWQLALGVIALVVLAPLGEELLFRGLLLRALARRLRFWPAALISSGTFAASHADAYVIWPRAISVLVTGLALAWLYRRRGYWAAVVAHATVNAVAAAALVASS